jgi:regulator of replication initiation timing
MMPKVKKGPKNPTMEKLKVQIAAYVLRIEDSTKIIKKLESEIGKLTKENEKLTTERDHLRDDLNTGKRAK